MKVSVVVVTYNRLNLLKECLSNLLNQNYEINSIFVVNNKSTDGTKEYLNSFNNNKVIPINSDKNLGGAGGFSLGTKMAYEKSDSDYFWLMDDDTMPTNNSLDSLIQAVNKLKNNFGFLCSNVRFWKDNKPSILNTPVIGDNWTDKSSDGIIKVQSASFVSVLINSKVIEKLGLPISDMFIWADDVEYTTRISSKYPSYFIPGSIVVHKCTNNSSDESVLNAEEHRLIYYKCMFRNRLYICKNYYNNFYLVKKILKYLSNIIVIPFKSKNHKLKRINYTIAGIWNGIFFNPKIRFPNKK